MSLSMDSLSQTSTGISGLDEVLRGGYVRGRMYLVYGSPGTGKTIAGLHFLEAGLERDETVLYVHGEESRSEIVTNAAAVGIDVGDAEFLDLGPDSEFFTENRAYDLVEPGEIERDRYTRKIHGAVGEIDPDRIVVDPITQLRYVQATEKQFRREIVSFMRFLKDRDVTVVATATPAPDQRYETELQSLSDGIVRLSAGDGGRRLEVTKHRSVGQAHGDHGMEIRESGIEVYPAVTPERHTQTIGDAQVSTGVDELDELLGGGIERNTVTFISGPTGCGKTTLGTQFCARAAEDAPAAVYLFEESVDSFTRRSEALGIPVTALCEAGQLHLEAVEPQAQSAEEFASIVRRDVDRKGITTVLIDGIDGYTMAIQGDRRELVANLHSLSRYLTNQDVTVLVTDEITEVTGISSATSIDASYIADNIVILSYVEVEGTLQKVVGVLKKRVGPFGHALRRFELGPDGIVVGDRLAGVTGILQGTPQLRGDAGDP